MSVSVLLSLRERLGLTRTAPAEDLIVRLQNGESAAVAEAYDRHHKEVRAFARRFLHDDTAAEDLVHDVFVALPEAIRRFRSESALGTFLIAIAVNHARNHLRTAIRRRRVMDHYGPSEGERVHSQDPEHETQRKQLALKLQTALDALPLDQRTAFILCEVEERSAAEVSAIVDAPEATVRTRLFHARRKLRELLSEEVSR